MITLGVCGSIAAYKACDLVRQLQEKGLSVAVAMTPEATEFVTPLTFAALTGKTVFSDVCDGQAWQMQHIAMAKETKVFVIAPATANMLAKLAHGLADDPVSSLALTIQAPVIVVPAMNDAMYSHVAVQENIRILKSRGVHVIDPVPGKLACGVVGVGHLAQVEDIVKHVQAVLK